MCFLLLSSFLNIGANNFLPIFCSYYSGTNGKLQRLPNIPIKFTKHVNECFAVGFCFVETFDSPSKSFMCNTDVVYHRWLFFSISIASIRQKKMLFCGMKKIPYRSYHHISYISYRLAAHKHFMYWRSHAMHLHSIMFAINRNILVHKRYNNNNLKTCKTLCNWYKIVSYCFTFILGL